MKESNLKESNIIAKKNIFYAFHPIIKIIESQTDNMKSFIFELDDLPQRLQTKFPFVKN
jgi:hypothetical protein